MASGTIKAGTLSIEEGGTGAITWSDAAEAINFLAGTTVAGPSVDLDSTLLSVVRARTNSTTNTGLYNAIGSNFAYVIQIFYSADPGSKGTENARLQIAFPYRGTDKKMAWRTYQSGWGSWHVITAS